MCTATFTHHFTCCHSVLLSLTPCRHSPNCLLFGSSRLITLSVPPSSPCPCTLHPLRTTLPFPHHHHPHAFANYCIENNIHIRDIFPNVPGWVLDTQGRRVGARLTPWRPIQFVVAWYRAHERAKRGMEPLSVPTNTNESVGAAGDMAIDFDSWGAVPEVEVKDESIKIDLKSGVKVELKEEEGGEGGERGVKVEVKIEGDEGRSEREREELSGLLAREMGRIFKVEEGEGRGLPFRLAVEGKKK